MSDNERKLRSGGTTSAVSLDKTKKYKLNTSGTLVEATTEGDTDIIFSGSKSSLRRIADLERNVSILAARTQTEDGSGDGSGGGTVEKASKWTNARTITLGGDLSGSVSIDGSANVTLSATVAANSVALGTDTTGNYMVNVSAGTGISVSHTQGEGSTATVSLNATTDNVSEGASNLYFTNARARSAVSFTAGSGAYNSTTGVITIPTNTNQLTNGAGFITGYTETSTLANVTARGATTTAALSTGALTVSGAITATGEITAYYSDANLKKDIVEITNPIEKVMSLRGVTFRPNETALALGITDKEEVGVIAQEVEAVLPQLVTPSAFAGYKTVKYDKLTALLLEAVKAQQLQIDALRAEIAKLGGSAKTEL